MRELTLDEKSLFESRAIQAVALFGKWYDDPHNTIKKVVENKEEHKNAILGYIETFVVIKDAIKNGQFYAGIASVSASGLSRKLFLAFYHKDRLLEVTEFGYYLSGCNRKRRHSGCGYDVRGKCLENLGFALGLTDEEIKPYWPLNISGE